MKSFIKAIMVLNLGVLTACASGSCKGTKRQPPYYPENGTAVDIMDGSQKSTKPADTVLVYKYDGSKQCNMGTPITLDEMSKELKGIKVYSQTKKTDNLMHVQMCGGPTGRANVFEIASKDLSLAEKLGFKKWAFE